MSQIEFDTTRTVCPQCKEKGNRPILDHTTGDLICTSCGLVLQGQCLDEGQEWRVFAQEGVDLGARVVDAQRVDTFADDMVGDEDIVHGTSVGGSDAMAQSLQKIQRMAQQSTAGKIIRYLPFSIGSLPGVRPSGDKYVAHRAESQISCEGLTYCYEKKLTNEDKVQLLKWGQEVAGVVETTEHGVQWLRVTLQVASNTLKNTNSRIRDFCTNLGFDRAIQRRCSELILTLSKKDVLPKSIKAQFYLAIIYLACKEERVTRTFAELARTSGAAKVDQKSIEEQVKKLSKHLVNELSDNKLLDQNIEELMPRWVSQMQLSHEVNAPACEMTRLALAKGYVKKISQSAVAASSIFIVVRLIADGKLDEPSFMQCATTTRSTEAAVKQAYSDMKASINYLLAELPKLKSRLPGEQVDAPQAVAQALDRLPPAQLKPKLPELRQ